MSLAPGRIGRFVSAARTLLALQVLAALLALGVAAWAFFEVRGMAVERDQLKARVAELEAQRGAPVLPVGPAVPLGPDPLLNQTAPLDLPPPPVLVPPAAPDTNVILPAAPPATVTPPAPEAAPKAEPEPEPEPTEPVRRWDCSVANAQNPRCRPLMERPNLPLNALEPRGPALGRQPEPGARPPG